MFGLIITILSVASTIILATVVLSNNRHSFLHVFLFLLSLGFAGSIGANYFTTFYHDAPHILIWIRWTMSFAGLAVPSWYLFIRNFPHRSLVIPKNVVITAGIVTIGLMALALSPWMFTGVTLQNGNISAHPGFGLAIFFLAFAVYLTGMIRTFVRQMRSTYGIERAQLQYVLGATIVSFTLIILFNVIGPLVLHASALVTFTNIAPLVFTAIVAFTIVRYRLLDIRIIFRRTTVYFLTLFIILGVSAVLVDWGSNNFSGSTPIPWSLAVITFGLIVFDPLKLWIERLANRFFFTSLYNVQVTLADLGRELTHTIDLQQIVNSVVETIKTTMKLDRAGVLLYDQTTSNYHIVKNIGFNEENGISLVRNNFLTNYLTTKRRSVLLQELEGMQIAGQGNGEVGKLVVNMKRIEAALCLPLTFGKHLIGIIVLGSKVTKEAYTSGDLQLLDSIADQASIAIQNGLLYQQVQDFNKNLQSKVDEQTKDISEKNEHLQELIKMKSEFLTIASHQLRTPLTAVRGLLAMQADGDFDNLSKTEVKTEQRHMLDSANRLSSIVNDLLKAMELEGGSLNFEFQEVQLEDMVDSVCSDLKPNYDSKQLYLKFEHPTPPLPKIEAEPKMLHEVLMNIVDNAEKYTNSGGTTISALSKGDNIILTVKDTGIGVPKTDRPKLFQKFSRGEKSTFQHTDGSGLGLFIAKNVVDEHHGKIDITSDGEGKGATVTIILPIHQPSHSA